MAKDVDEAGFGVEVIERSHQVPVVVDFWAEWCGPCRMLGPVLEGLAGQAGGAWELVKVDTDENQDLAMELGIQGIPAVKAFVGGKVVAEFVGARGAREVAQWLDGFLPGPAEARRQARLEGYRREAGPEPADALRARLTAKPDDLEARWRLAHHHLAAEDWEGGLGQLLDLVQRDRSYRGDGARKQMLAVFDAVGVRSPLAEQWRDRLAKVLF